MKLINYVQAFLGLFFFSVYNLSAQKNIVLRSNLKYPSQTCANIWGYVDSLGNEYALVGASKGLSIVDVTNPDAPKKIKQIPGPHSLWKEVETWGKYAYVVSEGGRGLQIIDLSKLPDSTALVSKYWEPAYNGDTLKKVHSLHIDNGYAYLYGGTYKGALICDLADPWNPVIKGLFKDVYIHDGYVRNNILYGADIYNGYVWVIDVSNKANPLPLQTQATPSNFTHNTWLSDDSKTLFTTDEKSNSFLAAYDITTLSNITELDQIQTNPGSNAIIHNCHVLNDWVVCSYYREGVVIFDGHRPQNLVEVGKYDTYAAGNGDGFNGAWGVYPFLPSGTIVVSNIEDGLFVLTPTYKRACYLEGNVIDSVTGTAINTATILIKSTTVLDSTKNTGDYAVGIADTGTYTVVISKPGYITKTITGVNLTPGNVSILNVKLQPVSSAVADLKRTGIVSVFPNPVHGNFYVKYSMIDQGNKVANIELTDVAGRIVHTQAVVGNEGVILMNNIAEPGVYFLRINNGGNIGALTKIIKLD